MDSDLWVTFYKKRGGGGFVQNEDLFMIAVVCDRYGGSLTSLAAKRHFVL